MEEKIPSSKHAHTRSDTQSAKENENYFNWNNWLTDHYYSNAVASNKIVLLWYVFVVVLVLFGYVS